MIKTNSKIAGFSLIELLFAMLFLTIIVFGVIKLQTSNLTLSNTRQMELKAHSYAGQALEIVSALGFAAVSSCTEPCYPENGGSGYVIKSNGSESLDDGLFLRTVEHDETGLTAASLVTATVQWTDSSGEHSVSAKRVIFN